MLLLLQTLVSNVGYSATLITVLSFIVVFDSVFHCWLEFRDFINEFGCQVIPTFLRNGPAVGDTNELQSRHYFLLPAGLFIELAFLSLKK